MIVVDMKFGVDVRVILGKNYYETKSRTRSLGIGKAYGMVLLMDWLIWEEAGLLEVLKKVILLGHC